MKLVITGTTYAACFSDIEPLAVTAVGYGSRVTLEAPDLDTHKAWRERITVVACDLAWDGEQTGVVEVLYKDLERADLAAGMKATA